MSSYGLTEPTPPGAHAGFGLALMRRRECHLLLATPAKSLDESAHSQDARLSRRIWIGTDARRLPGMEAISTSGFTSDCTAFDGKQGHPARPDHPPLKDHLPRLVTDTKRPGKRAAIGPGPAPSDGPFSKASRQCRKFFVKRYKNTLQPAAHSAKSPPLTGCGRSSGVEHNLAKVRVGRSNRLARSS